MSTKQKAPEKIALALSIVLVVLGLATTVATLIFESFNIVRLLGLLLYILIIVYAVFFYRKPHGNMLKYATLLFAVLYSVQCSIIAVPSVYRAVACAIAVCLIAFIAGRLDRSKQNAVLAIIVLAVLIATPFISNIDKAREIPSESGSQVVEMAEGETAEPPAENEEPPAKPDEAQTIENTNMQNTAESEVNQVLPSFVTDIAQFNMAIIWLALCLGYYARYRQHKEAGFSDVPVEEQNKSEN